MTRVMKHSGPRRPQYEHDAQRPVVFLRDCPTGKVRFRGRKAARVMAERMAEKQGERFNAYSCDECTGWHIGRPGKGWS